METMNGKVAMVTGAAAGIGLACAEGFAKAGATVILVDINEPKEQAEKLNSEGYKAVSYRCDVSDTQAVKTMIDWIVTTYGRLDAAHNNAGIQTPQRPMAEITDEEFDRTVAVDLKGVWNCMRYEILQMLKQGGGAIVNTSSQGGVTGFPGQAAYIACKHAVGTEIDGARAGFRLCGKNGQRSGAEHGQKLCFHKHRCIYSDARCKSDAKRYEKLPGIATEKVRKI